MIYQKTVIRNLTFMHKILIYSFIVNFSSAEGLPTNQTIEVVQTEIITNQACQCKFKSKHYNWNNTQVPLEEQQPLFQIKHEYVLTNWTFYQTSSRFRCVYECIDNNGNKDLVEYTQSETQPGYYNGGQTAAKLFNCTSAVPAFTRRSTYYQTHEAISFSPLNSIINELVHWATAKNCKY